LPRIAPQHVASQSFAIRELLTSEQGLESLDLNLNGRLAYRTRIPRANGLGAFRFQALPLLGLLPASLDFNLLLLSSSFVFEVEIVALSFKRI
jgi:hypothetical protein